MRSEKWRALSAFPFFPVQEIVWESQTVACGGEMMDNNFRNIIWTWTNNFVYSYFYIELKAP